MARCLLVRKAVAGIVDAVDREHREVVTTNRAARCQARRSGSACASVAAASAPCISCLSGSDADR